MHKKLISKETSYVQKITFKYVHEKAEIFIKPYLLFYVMRFSMLLNQFRLPTEFFQNSDFVFQKS